MKYLKYVLIGCCYFLACATKGTRKLDNAERLQVKVETYILNSDRAKSDLNYEKLNAFNESARVLISKKLSLDDVFNPVDGKYHYYKFIQTYEGEAIDLPGEEVNNKRRIFHDILILKTDNLNKIADGYQYTLEWSEFPFDGDLYRVTAQGITLRENLDIKLLKLKKLYDQSDFEEEGYLSFKKLQTPEKYN